MKGKLQEGDVAPDFSLPDQDGRTVSSNDIKGRKALVLYFYPADFTFVCPTELGDLADNYAQFQRLGVEIYSVSTDTHFTHKAWHASSETINKITFPMVGDVMAAGEGIETMLSLRMALPTMPMAAALSAAHLSAILFPETLRRLYNGDTALAASVAMATPDAAPRRRRPPLPIIGGVAASLIVGALALNQVLAINHRPGRYMAA